ncbi:hypothetical protein BC828DRAFT_142373 [Blastocladiella britannica]|nr:hypothetical protein BC828DRAFT_142373 [Blastocladiella britannica]
MSARRLDITTKSQEVTSSPMLAVEPPTPSAATAGANGFDLPRDSSFQDRAAIDALLEETARQRTSTISRSRSLVSLVRQSGNSLVEMAQTPTVRSKSREHAASDDDAAPTVRAPRSTGSRAYLALSADTFAPVEVSSSSATVTRGHSQPDQSAHDPHYRAASSSSSAVGGGTGGSNASLGPAAPLAPLTPHGKVASRALLERLAPPTSSGSASNLVSASRLVKSVSFTTLAHQRSGHGSLEGTIGGTASSGAGASHGQLPTLSMEKLPIARSTSGNHNHQAHGGADPTAAAAAVVQPKSTGIVGSISMASLARTLKSTHSSHTDDTAPNRAAGVDVATRPPPQWWSPTPILLRSAATAAGDHHASLVASGIASVHRTLGHPQYSSPELMGILPDPIPGPIPRSSSGRSVSTISQHSLTSAASSSLPLAAAPPPTRTLVRGGKSGKAQVSGSEEQLALSSTVTQRRGRGASGKSQSSLGDNRGQNNSSFSGDMTASGTSPTAAALVATSGATESNKSSTIRRSIAKMRNLFTVSTPSLFDPPGTTDSHGNSGSSAAQLSGGTVRRVPPQLNTRTFSNSTYSLSANHPASPISPMASPGAAHVAEIVPDVVDTIPVFVFLGPDFDGGNSIEVMFEISVSGSPRVDASLAMGLIAQAAGLSPTSSVPGSALYFYDPKLPGVRTRIANGGEMLDGLLQNYCEWRWIPKADTLLFSATVYVQGEEHGLRIQFRHDLTVADAALQLLERFGYSRANKMGLWLNSRFGLWLDEKRKLSEYEIGPSDKLELRSNTDHMFVRVQMPELNTRFVIKAPPHFTTPELCSLVLYSIKSKSLQLGHSDFLYGLYLIEEKQWLPESATVGEYAGLLTVREAMSSALEFKVHHQLLDVKLVNRPVLMLPPATEPSVFTTTATSTAAAGALAAAAVATNSSSTTANPNEAAAWQGGPARCTHRERATVSVAETAMALDVETLLSLDDPSALDNSIALGTAAGEVLAARTPVWESLRSVYNRSDLHVRPACQRLTLTTLVDRSVSGARVEMEVDPTVTLRDLLPSIARWLGLSPRYIRRVWANEIPGLGLGMFSRPSSAAATTAAVAATTVVVATAAAVASDTESMMDAAEALPLDFPIHQLHLRPLDVLIVDFDEPLWRNDGKRLLDLWELTAATGGLINSAAAGNVELSMWEEGPDIPGINVVFDDTGRIAAATLNKLIEKMTPEMVTNFNDCTFPPSFFHPCIVIFTHFVMGHGIRRFARGDVPVDLAFAYNA